MREILFRGKRLYSDEWFFGDLSHQWGKSHVFPEGGLNSFDYYEVDSNSVGQHIGLCDKNGKKIFEGDIVKFTRFNALGYTTRRTGVVRYYDKLPVFYIEATTGDAWDWCDCDAIEIIGNIHDNPELLRAE